MRTFPCVPLFSPVSISYCLTPEHSRYLPLCPEKRSCGQTFSVKIKNDTFYGGMRQSPKRNCIFSSCFYLQQIGMALDRPDCPRKLVPKLVPEGPRQNWMPTVQWHCKGTFILKEAKVWKRSRSRRCGPCRTGCYKSFLKQGAQPCREHSRGQFPDEIPDSPVWPPAGGGSLEECEDGRKIRPLVPGQFPGGGDGLRRVAGHDRGLILLSKREKRVAQRVQ